MSSAWTCLKCGFTAFDGPASYAGPQCRCFPNYAPYTGAHQPQAKPAVPLTEEDIRRIVREEIARSKPWAPN